jgi:hypothetical protein
LNIGPFLDFGSAAARSAEQGKVHGFGIDRVERAGQIFHELVGAGKADFGVPYAKNGQTLQQADGVGHGYIDIRLLHSVAQTGVKQLDFSGFTLRHLFQLPASERTVFTGMPRKEASCFYRTLTESSMARISHAPAVKSVLCQGTTSVVPLKLFNGSWAFSPWGNLFETDVL